MKTIQFITLVLVSFYSFAQPQIEWQKCLGGIDSEWATSVSLTSDGGYIIAGAAESTDGDVTVNHGAIDGWLVKLQSNGTLEWQKCFGGSGWEVFESVYPTSDGGYIALGYTGSDDGNVTTFYGGYYDLWVVKVNANGNLQWQKSLGGSDWDFVDLSTTIKQTSDGGYIIGAYTKSNDIDVAGNHGLNDGWLVKLDASGLIEWQKCLGGTGNDFLSSVHQDSDGGYIVCGVTNSNDGDVSGIHEGTWLLGAELTATTDCWVVKLDSSGEIIWQRCYGGYFNETAADIQPTTGGGWIMVAQTNSTDGDVSGFHNGFDTEVADGWIVNLDSDGNIIWQNCFGGSSLDYLFAVQQSEDDGFVVFGRTASNDGDVSGTHVAPDGFSYPLDYWIYKLSPEGMLEWQKCLGSDNNDFCQSGVQTPEGGFVLAGSVMENGGDVSGFHEGSDITTTDCWIVKLAPMDPMASVTDMSTMSMTVYPNPAEESITFLSENKLIGFNYRLTNLMGKEVMSGKICAQQTQLSLLNIPAGTYLLKVENGPSVKVLKY